MRQMQSHKRGRNFIETQQRNGGERSSTLVGKNRGSEPGDYWDGEQTGTERDNRGRGVEIRGGPELVNAT